MKRVESVSKVGKCVCVGGGVISRVPCVVPSGGYRNKAMGGGGGAVILGGGIFWSVLFSPPPPPPPPPMVPLPSTSHWVWNSGARHKLTFHASMHAIHNLIIMKCMIDSN